MPQLNPSAHDLKQTKPSKQNEKAPSFMIPIFKMLVLFYRIYLGWLFGKCFMLIGTGMGMRDKLHVDGQE